VVAFVTVDYACVARARGNTLVGMLDPFAPDTAQASQTTCPLPPYPPTSLDTDPRKAARALYWQGWRVSSIARHLDLKRGTVNSWRERDKWDEASAIDKVNSALEIRLIALIAKEKKDGADFKEIDLLGRQLERTARVTKYGETGKESDLNPNIAARNAGPKRKPERNTISDDQAKKIREAFLDCLFDYQKVWYRNREQRTRMVLKSRQIGATFYFAREALVDAIETGHNKIFLSASRSQAFIFRNYIKKFAKEAADVELEGDPIILPNGSELRFLGTNSATAQGYHGDFYFDEFFWVPKFKELNKLASAMAMHKHWRKTYFSTPSSMSHEAYAMWTGKDGRKRKKDEGFSLDLSHNALAGGLVCADRKWRQIVTVEDAVAGGCDLFDLDELLDEYSEADYANLLMCQFIDDTASVFKFSDLQACMVDSWVEWAADYKPFALRPFGHKRVWVGYDPALTGDSAGCVVLAPPAVPGGKFRVLEKHQWRGLDFEAQAESIRKITQRFNVEYIGIDTTGLGAAVHQLVSKFFPQAQAINYSPEVKSRLVLKGISVVSKGRLEFDAGWVDFAQSFLAIRKTITGSGRHVTYVAARNEEIGHADLAWACLHALGNEPLEGMTTLNGGFMEFS
jgi:uncharacterized protein YjcR